MGDFIMIGGITPKDKAKELISCFLLITSNDVCSFDERGTYGKLRAAKKCAVVCVDAIIKSHLDAKWLVNSATTNTEYWNAVKDELEKEMVLI